MREPASSELRHEVGEAEGGETFAIDRYPVIDEVIFKATKDPRNL